MSTISRKFPPPWNLFSTIWRDITNLSLHASVWNKWSNRRVEPFACTPCVSRFNFSIGGCVPPSSSLPPRSNSDDRLSSRGQFNRFPHGFNRCHLVVYSSWSAVSKLRDNPVYLSPLSISPPNTEGIPSFSDGSLESASTTRSIRSLIHRFRSLSGVEYITGGMRLYGLRVVRASSYIEDRVDR